MREEVSAKHVEGLTLREIITVGAITGIISAIATTIGVRWYAQSRETSWAISCQENLIKIEYAMEQWAVANKKDNGSTVTWSGLSPYLKQTPLCPGGGSYAQIFTVGATPTCDYTPPGWLGAEGHKYRHIVPDDVD